MSQWTVYMLDCDGRALYTGVTTDVERRLREHRGGGAKAARYTRSRHALALAYRVEVPDKSLAMRIEYRLKRLPAAEKRAIAENDVGLALLCERLGLDEAPS